MGLTIPAYAQEGICKIIKRITKRKIMILLYIYPYQNAIKKRRLYLCPILPVHPWIEKDPIICRENAKKMVDSSAVHQICCKINY